ncbi:uncharacterized protein LOC111039478 [Myzus persicae]|uniref:uncharacterized protein LOC111037811 n=1 Tax=Myzus persicae TaxID=13164 RepID=UPI000B938E80|nr:uncharacterized protein LOC111037811 [Myzus persicae]XP_022178712.1 uncharacterized protein LOC111039478 [Myzus persicae]
MILDTDKFIVENEKRKELWDIASTNYANKIIKRNSWIDVCRIFCEKYDEMPTIEQNEMIKEVQRKWKSLRNCFAREQSRRKNIKSGSGQSSWKTYVFYNQLSFLGSSATNRPTTSNVTPTHDDDDDDDDNDELGTEQNTQDSEHFFESTEESQTRRNQRQKKKSKSNHNESEENLFGTIARSLEFRNQMEKEAMEDQDRLFLLSLVGDLKKVPPHLKMQVKSNIINVISHSLALQPQRIDFDPRCQLNPPNSYQTLPFTQHPFGLQQAATSQQPLSTFTQAFPNHYTKRMSDVQYNNQNINYAMDTSSTSTNSNNSSLDVESSPPINSNLVSYINDYTSSDN